MYEIRFSQGALQDIKKLRAYDRKWILSEIEEKLSQQPMKLTRSQKPLKGLVPPFEAIVPSWGLRVGDYRVFYELDKDTKTVYVRAIRRKPPHRTTEGIL